MAIFREVAISSLLCFAVLTSARREVLVTSHLGAQRTGKEVNKESYADGDLTQGHCTMFKPGGKAPVGATLEDGPDGGKICLLKWDQRTAKRKDVPKYCDKIFSAGPITSKDAKFEKAGCNCIYVKPENVELEPSQHAKVAFSCFLAPGTQAQGSSHDQAVSAADTKKEPVKPVIDKVVPTDKRVETADDAKKDLKKEKTDKVETTSNVVKPAQSDASTVMGHLYFQTRNQGSMWVRYSAEEVPDAWAVFTPGAGLKKFELKRETEVQSKTNTLNDKGMSLLLPGWAGFFKLAKRKGKGDITINKVQSEELGFAILQKDESILHPQVGTAFDISSGVAAAAYTKKVYSGVTTIGLNEFSRTCKQSTDCDVVTF